VIHLSQPDPAQEHRRRLWVDKSWARYPQPLGVTMKDDGNDYDDEPPQEPGDEPKAAGAGPAVKECMAWLEGRIAGDSVGIGVLREEREEEKGGSAKVLYRAKKKLGLVEEAGAGGRKFWRFEDSETPS
jgi:hypothetical protein